METLIKDKTNRQIQKEQTRAKLIARAESLFAKQGIGNTTTAEIAKSLKLSHATVFIHFPTREDLILAVVDKFAERLSAELGQRCSSDMSLKEMLKAHLSVLSEFEDFYLRLISESQSLPPGIRGQVYALNASLSYRFYRAGQVLVQSAEHKKLTQPVFFNTWMALIHYAILNRDLFSEQTPILVHNGEDLIRQFLTLIKTT